MKRTLCLLLAALLLSGLWGCHYSDGGDILEPVEFFYPRRSETYVYGAEDGVIASEIREASGRIGDLNYLLTMYLRGPQDPSLRSPFPANCALEEVRSGGNTLCVVLSEDFMALEGMELTLACASLAKTGLALTGLERVRIESASDSKNFSMTLEKSSLLLSDDGVLDAQSE